MDLRDKKGFITIYVMLAMMFFVVFVVTASVTASRKIKLQTEANSALFDIYSEDIDYILQENEMTIPIYTQAQFEQIINWIYPSIDADPSTNSNDEYIYINDAIYFLEGSKYNYYSFVLKTDLWLDGKSNNQGIGNSDEDKNQDKKDYPYIPTVENIHKVYKTLKDKTESNGHNIFLQIDEKMYVYDALEIPISTAEDFLKIGTGDELANGVTASDNLTYRIIRNIDLSGSTYERDENVDFNGRIIGDNKIISGLTLSNSFFKSNSDSGNIENLTFVKVSVVGDDDINDNFGIIAGSNSGKISNCNIMLEKSQETNNTIDSIKCGTYALGGMVGSNSGQISNCKIQGIDISTCTASNIGGIVGRNSTEGEIINITVSGKISITSIGECTGGIVGKNEGKIENVGISSNIILTANNSSYSDVVNIGGISGDNEGSIEKILMSGNYGNVSMQNEITNVNIGAITGNNTGNIQNCIATGKIENNNGETNSQTSIGGISGYSSEGEISYCYSNVEIINKNNIKSIGGIVGYIEKEMQIDNCAYVNGIYSNINIPIGGIVGMVNKNATINSCYMNGVISKGTNAGAILGTVGSSIETITLGTETENVLYYNHAILATGKELLQNNAVSKNGCVALTTDQMSIKTQNLKDQILGIIKPNNYRYIKIVITGRNSENNINNELMQMSEWMFLDSSGNRFNWGNAIFSTNNNGNPTEEYIYLFDGIVPDSTTIKNKYCCHMGGNDVEITITLPEDNKIDIEKFNRYCYYTGNDNSNEGASCHERTPVSWKIYFSYDSIFEETEKLVEVINTRKYEENYNKDYTQIGPFDFK